MYSIKKSVSFKNIKILLTLSLSIFFIQRFALFAWSFFSPNSNLSVSFIETCKAFFIGTIFDFSLSIYALIPFAVILLLFPKFKSESIAKKSFFWIVNLFNFMFIFFVLYMALSEMFFWDEFTARYNFIAVDYLIYTTEVLKNIWESYPTFKLLLALLLATLTILFQINTRLKIELTQKDHLTEKLAVPSGFLIVALLNYLLITQSFSQLPKDISYQEISKNGAYSLFYSYFENQINYDQFYIKLDKETAFKRVKDLLPEGNYISSEKGNTDIKRDIIYPKSSSKMNVVLVLMESMGARFMNAYGNTENLTPNLDSLATKGLFFNNIYATGTRTVRGIEAITLSVPPTPGQSIVRRPNNEKLVTINSYFAQAGYDVDFLYGGYAYFDNMKYYFENNDAKVLDIANTNSADIQFSNAWGMSDEDLYKFSIRSADQSFKSKTPFFQIVLTTSNHRPFTYPEGKIDIPSGSGRKGAVKYADYSIGKFLEEAQTKPWFDSTIFVFVADHDAGVAGNTEVNSQDYLIPLIFYAPKSIEPEKISKLGSQIDVGPTLLGLLNISHESFGFGYDLRKKDGLERAFISNYQKIGYMKKNFLTLLEPGRKFKQYKISDSKYEDVDLEKDQLENTVSFYQTASSLYKENKLKSKDEKLIIQ